MTLNSTTTKTQLLNHIKRTLIQQKLSLNSRKLYLADIKRFLNWLSTSDFTPSRLTSPQVYLNYLKSLQQKQASTALLKRTIASLKQLGKIINQLYNLGNPTLNLSITNHQSSTSQQKPFFNYITQFTNYLKQQQLSNSTIKSYKSDVLRCLDWIGNHSSSTELAEVLTNQNIKKYLKYLNKSSNHSTSTLTRKLASLTRFQTWYFKHHQLPKSSHNKKPKPTTPLTKLNQLKSTLSPSSSPSHHSIFNIQYSIFSIFLILLLTLGLTYFGYRAFSKDQVLLSQAYPSTPISPNRQLSFQGRLEDSSGTPIASSTNLIFKLYDANTGGTELYSTGTCAITPDSDGIFSTQIGSDCGSAIPSSVFTENADVWLEVTVDTETLTPRQQIATVAFALNSQTLQGIPLSATMSAIANTIVPMNQWGEIIIGEQSPHMTGVSGTFAISAPALSLTTTSGSNGNISIAPDGTGQVNLTGNTTSTNFLNITNAQLTSGSLIHGYVGNDTATGNLLTLSSGTTEAEKFTLDTNGNLFTAGNATASGNLTMGGQLQLGRFASNPTTIGEGSMYFNTTDNKLYYYNSSAWTEVGSGSSNNSTSYWRLLNGTISPVNDTLDLLIGATATSSAKFAFTNINNSTPTLSMANQASAIDLTNSTVNALSIESGLMSFDTSNSRIGIGTTSPAYTLDIAGSVSLDSLNINNAYTFPTTDGTANYVLQTDGSGSVNWADINSTVAGDIFWTSSNGALYPKNSTMDLFIGGTATDSAKFAFLNIDSGTPTASISGNLSLKTPTGSNPSTQLNILNGGNFNLQTSVGGDAGLSSRLFINNSGNVGIGTTSPTSKLTIAGSSSTISNGSGDITIDSASDFISLSGDSLGNLLNLDVSGNATIGGQLRLGNYTSNPTTSIGKGSLIYNTTDDKIYYHNGSSWNEIGSGSSYWSYSSPNLYPINATDQVAIGTTTTSEMISQFYLTNGSTLGKALAIFNQTESQDILTASASGVTKFRIGNDGYTYAQRFVDLASSSYYLDPSATNTSLTVAGNVGIGTTSPGAKLHIIKNSTYNSESSAGISVSDDTSDVKISIGADATNNVGYIQSYDPGNSYSTRPLTLQAAGGNVGIGTSSAETKLTVYGGIKVNDDNATMGVWNSMISHGKFQSSTNDYNHALMIKANPDASYLTGATNIYSEAVLVSALVDTQFGANTLTRQIGLGVQHGAYFGGASGSTITNSYGIKINPYARGATNITNMYDLYLGSGYSDGTGTITNHYSLYQQDSNSTNYFAGNVGIGTTSPSGKLSVYGSSRNDLVIQTSDNTQSQGIAFQNSGGSYTWNIYRTDAGSNYADLRFATGLNTANSLLTDVVTFTNTGNVGIGTTSPTQKLDVNGYIAAQRLIDTASTSYYLDPASTGTSLSIEGDIVSNGAFTISSNGNNDITIDAGTGTVIIGDGTGKLNAGTIDPPYTIDGQKYATYLAGMTGVKEETTGTIYTSEYIPNHGYRALINLASAPQGSDLWLFRQVTNLYQNFDNLVILLSANTNTQTWYQLHPDKGVIEVYSSQPTRISYRLTAPRFDSDSWHNSRTDNNLGFNLEGQPNWDNQDPITPPNTDNFSLSQLADHTWKLINTTTQNLIESTLTASKAIIANLSAGLIQTQELVSPLIQTNTIATDTRLTITRTANSTSTDPLLQIDGELSASTISARLAHFQEITTHKLYADEVIVDKLTANSIEGLDAKIASISAGSTTELTDEELETITDRIKARLAKLSATAEDIPLPPEATSPASTPDPLLTSTPIASDSATLASLDADFVTINNYLAVIGQATITNLDITGNFYTNSITAKSDTLALQPNGGTIKLASNTLVIDSTTQQVAINGDLTVSGKILADSAQLNSLQLGSPATPSATPSSQLGQLLAVYNEQGEAVATIDASGSASFKDLSTQIITIASPSDATQSASASALAQALNTTSTTNATAGKSTLTTPNTEIAIESPYVTDNTLVYLTPTTNTDNKVLFVKTKQTCQTTDNEQTSTNCTPSFTVAIDSPASTNIDFNWWIIRLEAQP